MRIRLFPAIIVLSLLALVATACSVAQGAQPGPSLAPEMTAIASSAPASAQVEQTAGGVSCAENACKKKLGTPPETASAEGAPVAGAPIEGAFAQEASPKNAGGQAAEVAIALPAETRQDAQASVTVEVTPAGGTSGTLIFDVSMNTHSVELGYDMTKIATLTDDQGRNYPAKSWDGASGGHHRQGSLTLEVPTGAAPKSLELNLAGIGGAPTRPFKWDVE
jgi:hypothetical protein